MFVQIRVVALYSEIGEDRGEGAMHSYNHVCSTTIREPFHNTYCTLCVQVPLVHNKLRVHRQLTANIHWP